MMNFILSNSTSLGHIAQEMQRISFFFSLDKMRQAADFLKVAEQQHQDEPPQLTNSSLICMV